MACALSVLPVLHPFFRDIGETALLGNSRFGFCGFAAIHRIYAAGDRTTASYLLIERKFKNMT